MRGSPTSPPSNASAGLPPVAGAGEWIQLEEPVLHEASDPGRAAQYSDRLSRAKPRLPILLLTDSGVYVPPETLSHSMETGDPAALIREVASMLVGNIYVRELPSPNPK